MTNAPCEWVCADRREEYSPLNLVFELVSIQFAFFVGIYGLAWYPTWGAALATFYAIWCFGSYFVVFRIVLCPNCYYYGRWCPDGMGKYAKKVFGVRGSVQRYKKALLIPTIGWAVIFTFPIAVLVVYFIFDPGLAIPVGWLGGIVMPVLWYATLFAIVILVYFTIHIRIACRGCAHVETCNLLKAFSFLRFLTRQRNGKEWL